MTTQTELETVKHKRYSEWSDSFPNGVIFLHQSPFGAMAAVNRWTGEILGGWYRSTALTAGEIILLNEICKGRE